MHRFRMMILLLLPAVSIAAPQADAPLRDEQQRRIHQQLKDEYKRIIYIGGEAPKEQAPEVAAPEQCVRIAAINVNQSALLSEADKTALISPYLNRCLGLAALNELSRAITLEYIARGYITSRAYLKPQDISDGVVDVEVAEGKVERLITEGRDMNLVFLSLTGKPLNLRVIERGLEQINRLDSNHAVVRLLPGTQAGYSVVEIINQQDFPLHGNVTISNYGSEATGKIQYASELWWDNPLHMTDALQLRINGSRGDEDAGTAGYSASYSLPLGRALFTVSHSYFDYRQMIAGSIDRFESSGRNEVSGFATDYKLFHNQRHKLELNAGLEKKRTRNFIEDVMIETASYELSVARLSFKHVYAGNSLEAYDVLGYNRGTDWFGAIQDGGLDESFTKWTLALGLTKQFRLIAPASVSVAFYGQYSGDNLYSGEQIGVGGPYSVRGFQQGLSGNSGWYLRNDVAMRLGRVFPYLAIDLGKIICTIDAGCGSLAGAAYGVRMYYRAFSVDMFASLPIGDPPSGSEAKLFLGAALNISF